LAELESHLNEDVCSGIMHHLQGLQVTVTGYFPPKVEDFQWLHNPFVLSLPEKDSQQNNRRHINAGVFERHV
jgi:hypothetical protein